MGLEVLDRLQRRRRETAEAAQPFAERGRGHGAGCRRERLVDFHRRNRAEGPGPGNVASEAWADFGHGSVNCRDSKAGPASFPGNERGVGRSGEE